MNDKTINAVKKENSGSKNPEKILFMSIDEALARLKTSQSGLTSKEAKKRLKIYGYNELVRKKRTALAEFLSHFRSPLVIILLIAGLISGFLGELTNAIIIFVIVLLSTLLLFYQESRADKASEMLKKKVTTTATVLRDGVKKEVDLREIVPGDIIYLSAGDIVPADARIITAKDLFVNQSVLTGESLPVEKTPNPPTTEGAPITEWNNYLFLGTSVVSGAATAVVVNTGNSTEYGKIARRLAERPPETEFERGLRRFGFLIVEVTFLLVLFVFLINALYKRNVLESLLFSVALAVGLTPELLPMIITLTLSKGAISMSRKGVIVKRLSSIQNLGSMDVLCTDKTGTLTENRIKLVLHVDLEGKDNDKVLLYSFLNSYHQTGLKSPLDEAILKHEEIDVKGYQKIDEIPFDFSRRRISVVVEREGQRILISKGSPEILTTCSSCEFGGRMVELTRALRDRIEQKYYDLSSEGFRTLGVSYKMVGEKQVYSVNDEAGMVFLGFVAFIDPPKETARESIQLLRKHGVDLKIITGDNEIVTRKVCEYLNFEIRGIVLGNEIDQMQDDALARVVEEANVFARVTPVQKDRIILALKKNGHVVGYMGDGINDAPPLKTSDVGISVDNAVDVAKESADIILLQSDLKVLNDGVIEGRKAFGNAMKYIMMGTSSNFGNMFSAAGASLFLPFLPMLPTQILLNNLLYDLSEFTIPTDNVDPEYIEKPKKMNVAFIRRFMLIMGPISSVFDFLTFFLMILVFSAIEPVFQTAWFIESLFTQTLVIFVIRTRMPPFKSRPSKALLVSSVSVLGVALLVPLTPVGKLFGFVEPPPLFYAFLAGFVVSYLALVEIVKRWFYGRYSALLEQVSAPAETIPYMGRTAVLIQDMVAVIALRPESEMSIDSLLEDLKTGTSYPLEPERVVQGLNHLRRAGVIRIDWHKRLIARQEAMRDYVIKYVVGGPMWPRIAQNWRRMGRVVKSKYGKINPDFQGLLAPQSKR
ncbi:MAG: magnesium-translocating P-type ATPase [Desulfomonilaceae bacterium]